MFQAQVELWHEIAGEGAPVLLIHEGICDSRMWDPQWRTFPSTHRTVRCDLRGFGRTPLPAEPYAHARDVVELLDRLELGPAALVGVSLGGCVALDVAVARPDLVDRLVLVGSSLPDHEWSDTVSRYAEEEEAALKQGISTPPSRPPCGCGSTGRSAGPARSIRPYGASSPRCSVARSSLQLPTWEDAEEELLVPDLASRYVELRVPTLVLVGSEDVSDMHAIAERLASGIPGARKAEIAATAHVRLFSARRSFDRLVLGFLGSEGRTA